MSDLHEIIEDAVTDVEAPLPTETQTEQTDTPAPTPSEAAPEATEAAPESTSAVQSPAAKAQAEQAQSGTEDDFAKKYGLAPQKPGERENRLPYSAVKRIVGNAEKRAVEPLQTKLKDFETKVTDYEGRLNKVAQFEQVMMNDPATFLNLLAQIPAYRQIFEGLQRKDSVQPQAPATPVATDPADQPPQPDQVMPDGSRIYSLEGFQKLQEYNNRKTEEKILKALGDRLAPIESERKRQEDARKLEEFRAQTYQQVNAQIAEAYTWPKFKENEPEIVKALQEDQRLSLEGAYRKVVFPKLSSDYNTMRAQVIQELKKAPTSTSTAASITSKPNVQAEGKPGDLESVIRNASKAAGLI